MRALRGDFFVAGAFYQAQIIQINTDFLDADFAEKYSH
jgi:hypothetical protein